MREKSNIITRVKAIKDGTKIELLYSDEVISKAMDRVFLDVIKEYKKNKGEMK